MALALALRKESRLLEALRMKKTKGKKQSKSSQLTVSRDDGGDIFSIYNLCLHEGLVCDIRIHKASGPRRAASPESSPRLLFSEADPPVAAVINLNPPPWRRIFGLARFNLACEASQASC